MTFRNHKYLCVYITLFLKCALQIAQSTPVHGRYTRDITDYELTVPALVNSEGNLLTFNLAQYYVHDFEHARNKREHSKEDIRHYNVVIGGVGHHMELQPNHGFISPNLVVERYTGYKTPVAARDIRRINREQCHFVGKVRGHRDSDVALSVCDGVAGYIRTDNGHYYIEPLAEHGPNDNGEHVHIVYKRQLGNKTFFAQEPPMHCGTTGNWRQSWKQRLKEEYERPGRSENERREGNSNSLTRYVETLVVADKRFLEFHKNTDYEVYILTVMNMVSNSYHDSSIGNDMNVVVVRIIYLEKEEKNLDITINPKAEETLNSFCKWQKAINPVSIEHPQHHDIALLLTRYDICTDDLKNCNLMGLAHVAAACTSNKACAINEDTGLVLGVVVAHELGHVLGCTHDDLEIGCSPKRGDGSFTVMAPYANLLTYGWSTCSRNFITTFFENNLGECLIDEPTEATFKFTEMLPGSVYDADFQCNQIFPGSTACKVNEDMFCKVLYCKVRQDSCSSKGEPPADGTKCGEKKWCFRGNCEEIGKRSSSVDGGWGSWGSWSPCTRSCGGGITFSERECDNPRPSNGGRYCTGLRKNIQICNKTPCDVKAISFREAQCEEFNKIPFKGKLYKWTSYLKTDDVCSLYCSNSAKFVKLAPRVKDGTSCKMGTKNRCVFGVCRIVGCDWVIDSDAMEDACGICNGDGTQCTLHNDLYKNATGYGYKKLTTIPKGSKNIYLIEEEPTDNMLAVANADQSKFYLNGDDLQRLPGSYDIGGAVGIYERSKTDRELLYISGPLESDITILAALYNEQNPGFRVKYADPTPEGGYTPEYHWEFLGWEECSRNCGGGTKVSKPQCVEMKSGEVANSFCSDTPKPDIKIEKCNEKPCKTRWRIGSWNECNACKDKSGFKFRVVECVHLSSKPGRDDVVTEDGFCPNPKPPTKQLCCSNKPCLNAREVQDTQISQLGRQINSHRFNRYPRDRQHKSTENSEIHVKEHSAEAVAIPCDEIQRFTSFTHENTRKKFGKSPGNSYLVSRTGDSGRHHENTRHTSQIRKRTRYLREVDNAKHTNHREHNLFNNRPASMGHRYISKHKRNYRSSNSARRTISHLNNGDALLDLLSKYRYVHRFGRSQTNYKHETRKPTKKTCGENKSTGKDTVSDIIPDEQLKLIEVPLKESHESVPLSDAAFESGGDKVTDTIDFCHRTVFTGAKAVEETNKLNSNRTELLTD